MKVLGVGNDKYICEIEYDEMYEILGQMDEEDFEIQPGQDIDLARVVRAARWIKNLDSEHIERAIKELNMALTGIQKVKTTAEKLTLFSKLKNEEGV